MAFGGLRFSPVAIGLLLTIALYPVLWLVFVRGFGGAYAFAALPLLVFGLGVWGLMPKTTREPF